MGPQAGYTDRDVEGWSIVAFVLALLLFVGTGGLSVALLTMDATLERREATDSVVITAGIVVAVVVLIVAFSAIGRVAIGSRPNELKGRGLSKAADILCVFVILNLVASVALVVLSRETVDAGVADQRDADVGLDEAIVCGDFRSLWHNEGLPAFQRDDEMRAVARQGERSEIAAFATASRHMAAAITAQPDVEVVEAAWEQFAEQCRAAGVEIG